MVPIVQQFIYIKQTHITDQRQEQIFYALAAYVRRHGRLPRPADDHQGYETNRKIEEDDGLIAGFVPFRDLNVPEKVAKNGYGQYFIYTVANQLTYASSTPEKPYWRICTPSLGYYTFCSVQSRHRLPPSANTLLAPQQKKANRNYDKDFPALWLSNYASRSATQAAINTPPSYEDLMASNNATWVSRDNLLAFYGTRRCDDMATDDPSGGRRQKPRVGLKS